MAHLTYIFKGAQVAMLRRDLMGNFSLGSETNLEAVSEVVDGGHCWFGLGYDFGQKVRSGTGLGYSCN